MTAELLTPLQPEAEESSPIFDELMHESANQTIETAESLSPTADRIESAVNRVTGFLRGRAEQKQKESDQKAAFESYGENIDATKDREKQERRDAAKLAIKRVGLSALTKLKSASMVSLGLGLMAGEATTRGAKTAGQTVKTNAEFAYAAAKDEVTSAAQRAGEKITDGWNKAENLAGRVGQNLENGIDTAITKSKESVNTAVTKAKDGIDTVKYTAYATKETIKYTKERFLARGEAALTRKYERHARWMRIKNEAKGMAESFRGNRTKTIGRAALGGNLFD